MSHPLAIKTATLRRRWYWRRWATGALRTVAAATALATAMIAVDYLFRFQDAGIRLIASLIFLSGSAYVTYRYWLRPAWQRLDEFDVARRLEQTFPELGDRLASALDFLHKSEDDATAGSPMLRRIVIAETAQAVEGLPLDEAEDARPLRRAAWFAAFALGIAALASVVSPSLMGIGLNRLTFPWGTAQWPRQNQLEFLNPPEQLAIGQSFEVELVDKNGQPPLDVTICYRVPQDGHDAVESEPMTPAGDLLLARRENVRRSFEFRAAGGDDDTMPWRSVKVVAPPELKLLKIKAHPPKYTGLPSESVDQHFRVLEGTRLEVDGEATDELRAARITFAEGEPIDATLAKDSLADARHEFKIVGDAWIAKKTTQYWLELESASGIVGRHGPWNMRVDPDTPPRVTWKQPEVDLYVTANAAIPIEVVATDNLAVLSMELIFARSDDPESATKNLPLFQGPPHAADGAAPEQTAAIHWDLAPLNLPEGAQLVVKATATDYRLWTGESSPRRITIISADALDARLAGQQEQILHYLEEALNRQRAVRSQVQSIEIQRREAGSLTPADGDTLQSAELSQRRVGDPLAQGARPAIVRLQADVENNRLDRPELVSQLNELQSALVKLADGPLATSDESLSAARKAADLLLANEEQPSPREAIEAQFAQHLSTAGIAQAEVIEELEKWLGRASQRAEFGRLARDIAQLRQDQLALRVSTQEDIGLATATLSPDELTPQQRADLLKAAEAQAELNRRLERLQAEMSLQESDRDAAEPSLAAALEQLRSRGTGAKMRDTTADLEQNRVASALERQQQVADELDEILNTLRNAGRPSPSAEQQAADRQAAIDAALDQLAKLEATVRLLAGQQERMLDDTEAIDTARGTAESHTTTQAESMRQLSEEQHHLELETRVAAEQFEGLGVFRLAMDEASEQMADAARGLSKLETGQPIQDAQREALRRLSQIADAFRREAQAQADANQPDAGEKGEAPGEGEKKPPPPLFDLAEIKLLRELQADVNRRTRLLEIQLAADTTDADQRQQLRWQAKITAAEQRRLAELVAEILSRDNEQGRAAELQE